MIIPKLACALRLGLLAPLLVDCAVPPASPSATAPRAAPSTPDASAAVSTESDAAVALDAAAPNDVAKTTCVAPKESCPEAPSCDKLRKALNTEFWQDASVHFVCSCAPVAKGPVTSDAVADAFESKWEVLWLEDCGYRPALRQTTRFAMTPLHERAGSVHPPSFFFSRAIRYARSNKTSWASEWDQFEKLLSKHLEGLVLVRFVGGSANDAGPPAEVTNFLIGRTKDGHLAGFFLDRDVWE